MLREGASTRVFDEGECFARAKCFAKVFDEGASTMVYE
jgi:hypothetical protein